MSHTSGYRKQRVVVIGAGPAGTAAAMRLHALGWQVLLVDRAAFPRFKVCGCCLNLAALSALSVIGCDQLIYRLGPTLLTDWRLATPGAAIQAALPGGVALSRLRMDAALVTEAASRGVKVVAPCEARIADVGLDYVDVRLTRCGQPERFDAAILASGLAGGGVARWLPWIQSPVGPLGIGTIVPSFDAVPDRTIQIACDETGYVGLVRLEDGHVDVAAALRRDVCDVGGQSPATAKAALLQAMNRILCRTGQELLPPIDPETLQTTPPLRRSRLPGYGRLLAVGDAAGYVEPFTGEGMAWAIQSGIAAAECLTDVDAAGNSGAAWTAQYVRLMRRRQWLCRLLSGTLASPAGSRWLMRLARAAPWTVRYAVRQLNRAGR